MNQGTNAWVSWRLGGVGSSDAPVIMGVSPYKTLRKLYFEKISDPDLYIADTDSGKQFIFEKGHRIERQARALLEIQHGGVEFRAGLCQMIDYSFMRASMDGANFEISEGKEFKLVSLKEFNEDKCPERYYPQIQHQYVVSGLNKIDIVLCVEVGKLKQLKIKEVEVPIDIDYINNKLMPAILNFWYNNVLDRNPPDYTRGDAIRITDKKLIEKIKKWKKEKAKYDKLNNQIIRLAVSLDFSKSSIYNSLPGPMTYYQKTIFRKRRTITERVEEECY